MHQYGVDLYNVAYNYVHEFYCDERLQLPTINNCLCVVDLHIRLQSNMESRFNCSICHSFASLDYASVVRHIGSVHAWEPRFKVTCDIDGCMRTYTSYRCYRAHIVNKHSEHNIISDERVNTEEAFLDHETHIYGTEEMDSVSFDDPVTEVSTERPKLYNKALFLLKLKEERRLSQLAVNGLIGDISTLLEEEILSLKNNVIKCMHEEHASTELITKINKQFSGKLAAPPFEGL